MTEDVEMLESVSEEEQVVVAKIKKSKKTKAIKK